MLYCTVFAVVASLSSLIAAIDIPGYIQLSYDNGSVHYVRHEKYPFSSVEDRSKATEFSLELTDGQDRHNIKAITEENTYYFGLMAYPEHHISEEFPANSAMVCLTRQRPYNSIAIDRGNRWLYAFGSESAVWQYNNASQELQAVWTDYNGTQVPMQIGLWDEQMLTAVTNQTAFAQKHGEIKMAKLFFMAK